MKKEYSLAFVVVIFILLSYLPLFICNNETIKLLTREDSYYEDATALFYLMGGGLLFFQFFKLRAKDRSGDKKGETNFFILLLGLFLIFCCLEEISWGERIFRFHVPGKLAQINEQKETNFHNLFLFSRYDRHEHLKTGIAKWFEASRLLSLFWFAFCVLIPFANLISRRFRQFFSTIKLPIVPFWLGMIFMFNYITAKTVQWILHPNYLQSLTEIKEAMVSFLFLMVSLEFIPKFRQHFTPIFRNL